MTLHLRLRLTLALAASALVISTAEAAPRRKRTLTVIAMQGATASDGTRYTLPLEGLEVTVRKKLPFGIGVARSLPDYVERGSIELGFRSRKWSGFEVQVTTHTKFPKQRVRTASGSRLNTFSFREDLTGTPGKRTTRHTHRLRPQAPYEVHTGAADGGMSNYLEAPTGLVIRYGGRAGEVRIEESRNLVTVPEGATVLDGLKAAAYVQACDSGLMRVEGSLPLGEFRGEFTGVRSDEALSEERAFASALSTFFYQPKYVFSWFVPLAQRQDVLRLLDTHMALLREQGRQPGATVTPELLEQQRRLGNRSAANVLGLLHDLEDREVDRGLFTLGPVEAWRVPLHELHEALLAVKKLRSGTWRQLLDRLPLDGRLDRTLQTELVIRMNGLDPDAPIAALGAAPSASSTASTQPRSSRSDLIRARAAKLPLPRPSAR